MLIAIVWFRVPKLYNLETMIYIPQVNANDYEQ